MYFLTTFVSLILAVLALSKSVLIEGIEAPQPSILSKILEYGGLVFIVISLVTFGYAIARLF